MCRGEGPPVGGREGPPVGRGQGHFSLLHDRPLGRELELALRLQLVLVHRFQEVRFYPDGVLLWFGRFRGSTRRLGCPGRRFGGSARGLRRSGRRFGGSARGTVFLHR